MSKLYINGHFLHQQLAGVQRYAREVIKGFDRGGYPYEILEPQEPFDSGRIGHNLWQQIVLPQKVNSGEALWSPANNGPVFARNHIITLHDIAVFPHPEWFTSSYVFWKRTLIPQIAKRARGILTVSEFSKGIICSHLDIEPHHVEVVYNGVDTDRFKPASEANTNTIRNKYGLKRPYLLTLGSLDPRKNFDRLISAWKQCKTQESVTNHVLAIAGGGDEKFSRFTIDNSDDSIKLLGYVDEEDLPALYSGATGFMLPSLFEGFGLPVVEAMACGTPVLTSNTTALDEISGNAALKVDPTSVDSIKEGIMELIESPTLRTTLVERGFERISCFSWDESAARIHHYLTD